MCRARTALTVLFDSEVTVLLGLGRSSHSPFRRPTREEGQADLAVALFLDQRQLAPVDDAASSSSTWDSRPDIAAPETRAA
jgi:hypothetical protein